MKLAAAAAALLGAAYAAGFLLSPWSDELVSDLPLYRSYAELFLDGVSPYGGVPFEYPPLAAPLIALPGLVSLDEHGYRGAFALLALALLIGLALACARLAGMTGGSRARALLAVAAAPLATGALIRTHFDLAPTLLAVAGLAAIAARSPRAGFALLGVGGAVKLFPLALVPLAAAWLAAAGQRRAAFEGAAIAVAIGLAAAGAAVAISPAGAWDALDYQGARPVQIESLPATVLNAVELIGGEAPRPHHSHRSDGLEHPAAAALGGAAHAALLAALAALTLAARALAPDRRGLALAGLGALAAFATLGKVLSPQFMVWLVPLGALAFAWRMHALAAASTAAVAATLLWFPDRYFDLVDRDGFPLAAVALRNALLALVLVLLARELLRMARPAAARSP